MKTWCRHIGQFADLQYTVKTVNWCGFLIKGFVPSSWKLCPICGTERPNSTPKVTHMRLKNQKAYFGKWRGDMLIISKQTNTMSLQRKDGSVGLFTNEELTRPKKPTTKRKASE
jgi:hypothetical protein